MKPGQSEPQIERNENENYQIKISVRRMGRRASERKYSLEHAPVSGCGLNAGRVGRKVKGEELWNDERNYKTGKRATAATVSVVGVFRQQLSKC